MEIVVSAGTPKTVLSDNTKNFRSKQFQELLNAHGACRMYTTLYHPQANNTERLNHMLVQCLATAIQESGEDWDLIVHHTATTYNQTSHASHHHI